jgi:hypothetical protein
MPEATRIWPDAETRIGAFVSIGPGGCDNLPFGLNLQPEATSLLWDISYNVRKIVEGYQLGTAEPGIPCQQAYYFDIWRWIEKVGFEHTVVEAIRTRTQHYMKTQGRESWARHCLRSLGESLYMPHSAAPSGKGCSPMVGGS